MDLDITAAHIFYIPAVVGLGGIVGYFVGRRHAEKLTAEHQARMRAGQAEGPGGRAARRAARRSGGEEGESED